MSTETDLKRAAWDYLMETVAAVDSKFSPMSWDAQADPVHAVIVLDHLRTATWAPDFGWRVQATHDATRTPDGTALYLDAGPFPPADVVADRLTAWTDNRLTLTEAQPYYPFRWGDLVPALRDAVSGRPVLIRCPHCGQWETARADENAFCGSCGAHMPPRECQARVTPEQDGEAGG